MSTWFKTLGTVDAQEDGSSVNISHLKPGTVGVTVECSSSPAWNGTWVLQVSNDETTWVQAPTTDGGVTATGTASKGYRLECAFKFMRLICSSFSAGSATGYVGGESMVAQAPMPTVTLEVKTTAAQNGAAVAVLYMAPFKSLHVSGTFTATLQLEGSNDGTNWTKIGDDITAPGFVSIGYVVAWLRIKTSAYTSGTPVAVLAGHGPQGT